MSSVYRILCLNHDPALEVGDDGWRSAQEALAAVADREAAPGYPRCDLMVGRYSYPLVEVCWPAARAAPARPGVD